MSILADRQQEGKKWLIIDTDAGVDDAVAISLALKLAPRYGYVVKYLSTEFGNCDLDQVIKNVAKTRRAAGCDASTGPTMIQGCSKPLVCPRMDATYFHGMDGLGNNTYPDVEHTGCAGDETTFADTMYDICAKAKQEGIEINFVSLGPLTNLATIISKHANFLFLLDKLTIMAGCGDGRGNVTRTAEFNVYADPEAAAAVFAALTRDSLCCTLVSYDITLKYPIPWKLFDRCIGVSTDEPNAPQTPLNDFLGSICSFTYNKCRTSNDVHEVEYCQGANICDSLCVAIALQDSSFVKTATAVNVDVELDGSMTRGQTVVDWGCFDGVVRHKNCNWIKTIDEEKWHQMVKDTFELSD